MSKFHYPLEHNIAPPDLIRVVCRPPEAGDPRHYACSFAFEAADGGICLRLVLDAGRHEVRMNSRDASGLWHTELTSRQTVFGAEWVDRIAFTLLEQTIEVVINEQFRLYFDCRLPVQSISRVTAEGCEVISLFHRKNPNYALDWRRLTQRSGQASTTSPFMPGVSLQPGVSFIVRAKNEEKNIRDCIGTIVDLAQEVVFVDNGSSDRTLDIVREMAAQHENIQIHQYPVKVPRVGRDHAMAMLSRSRNTLAEYYNWCLSHATRYNFTKWDADFIAIRGNLAEMMEVMDLPTRGDNICLWYTGLEVYTDGSRWWVDTHTFQHEYRLFSKWHGCQWVDIPPWEEIDQRYLFTANKQYFEKPVYLEVFRIDMDEFADRGIYVRDARDRARLEYLTHYSRHGCLPPNFVEVSGPQDPLFGRLGITSKHRNMMYRAERVWSSIPKMRNARTRDFVIYPSMTPQVRLVVGILACEKNMDRVEKIRRSWARDLSERGITYYFIIGRPGRAANIDGDILYLDCPDNYEGLPKKVLAMVQYIHDKTSFDYVMKIDDDCILNIDQLWQSGFWKYDYIGGGVAGGEGFMRDWHFGKCDDPELNGKAYDGYYLGSWYGGGFSYFLSRKSMECLTAAPDMMLEEIYEDKAVGDTLRRSRLLVGDLRDKFGALDHRHVAAGDNVPTDCMVIYDVPRLADYAQLLRLMKRTAQASATPQGHPLAWDGVISQPDWCDLEEFIQDEIAKAAE